MGLNEKYGLQMNCLKQPCCKLVWEEEVEEVKNGREDKENEKVE